jgi:EmrB/QacA subfamily drug resistance transporter
LTTIVNVALPDIADDLNAGIGELQWVLDGFLVALAGLLLLGSGLADRFGRKRVFLSGMAGFAVASVLCALAPSTIALIGGRVLMGAAAACVLPPALSLIAVMFPPEERAQALGVWAATAGAGLVIGPVLGGVLVHEVGWQAVFLVNVPVALVVVPAGIKVLPESKRTGTPPLDLLGVALSILSLVGIVFALIEGADAGWTNPAVVASGVIGVVAGAAFVRVELRGRHPLFDVRVLARPRSRAGRGDPRHLHRVPRNDLPAAAISPVRAGRSVVAAGLLRADRRGSRHRRRYNAVFSGARRPQDDFGRAPHSPPQPRCSCSRGRPRSPSSRSGPV